MKTTAKAKIVKCLGNVSNVAGEKPNDGLGYEVNWSWKLDRLPIGYRKKGRSDQRAEEPRRWQVRDLEREGK
jgi:hypothetical protein